MREGRRIADPTNAAPPAQPILGWWRDRNADQTFGFQGRLAGPSKSRAAPIADAGEGHLMTIAPTGAGKGRSVIIPTLLSYRGPVIVIDPKGENYQVTARRRREMGQEVFLLDPFEVTDRDDHGLNALDMIDEDSTQAYDQAMALAELLVPSHARQDPFWEDSARSLVTALLLHVAVDRPKSQANLMHVCELLHRNMDEMEHLFKAMQNSTNMQVRRLAGGFTVTEPRVMASILSVARTAMAVFNGECFARMSHTTDIPLDGVVRGDPMSVYLVLPPDKLDSHGRLLRLWVGCLMERICRRRHRVPSATLFILDEAAQLGTLQQLRRAITLLRGYGLRTWSFWQDLSQLKALYPDWETLFNNTRYIQTFGATTHMLARSISDMLNLPAEINPLTLARDQLILAEAGCEARVAGKPDYLSDSMFRGLYDDNPFYQPFRPRRLKHLATERRDALLRRWDHVTEPEPEPDEGKPEPYYPWETW